MPSAGWHPLLAVEELGAHLLVDLVHGKGLVVAAVADHALAVGLVLVDDEVAVLGIPVDAKGPGLAVVLPDEETHLLERQVVRPRKGEELLDRLWLAVAAAGHVGIGRAAVGALLIGLVDVVVAVVAFDLHSGTSVPFA